MKLIKSIKDIMALAKGYYRAYLISLLLAAGLSAARGNLITYIFKGLLNRRGTIAWCLLISGLTLLVSMGQRYFEYRIRVYMRLIPLRLKEGLFGGLVQADYGHLRDLGSGDLQSAFNKDLDQLESLYGNGLSSLVTTTVLGLNGVLVSLILDYRVGILSLALCSVGSLINLKVLPKLRSREGQYLTHHRDLVKRVSEMAYGYREVRVFNLEDMVENEFKKANKETSRHWFASFTLNGLLASVQWLLGKVTYLGVLIYGLSLIHKQTLSLGTLVAIMLQEEMIIFMYDNWMSYLRDVQKSLGSMEGLMTLMDLAKKGQVLDKIKSGGSAYILELKNLSLSLAGRQVLNQVNLRLVKGDRLVISGPSGQGKSSLLKIILGLMTSDEGQVLLGGIPMDVFEADDLRDQFSYLPQNPHLFAGTIGDNISCGRARGVVDEEELVQAAKLVGIHDFIMTLPAGYETPVGERGANLSGGQRQRVALARAFYRQAPILILDEPLSSQDQAHRQILLRAIDNIARVRTLIIVSHRPELLNLSCRHLSLQEGRLIERD